MKRTFPPISVWLATAILSVLVIFTSSFVLDVREGHGIFYRDFKDRMQDLEERYQIAEEDEVVLIFGSSLTAMGIQHHDYFYERSQTETGRPIHVFKIYMYSCSAADLQDLPDFFELAIRLKADIVCFEERLLAFNEYNPGMLHVPKWLERFSLRVEGAKEHLLLQIGKGLSDEPRTFDFFWKYHEETFGIDSTTFEPTAFNIRPYQHNKKVNQWLAKLTDIGTQVVMLNLPRPKVTEDALISARKEADFQTLLKAYQENLNLEHWVYPEILPYSHFTDAHLNRRGMERFSDWLFHQIKVAL